MAMQYRDITKTYDPFRMLFKLFEVQVIDNSACSITASCA